MATLKRKKDRNDENLRRTLHELVRDTSPNHYSRIPKDKKDLLKHLYANGSDGSLDCAIEDSIITEARNDYKLIMHGTDVKSLKSPQFLAYAFLKGKISDNEQSFFIARTGLSIQDFIEYSMEKLVMDKYRRDLLR
ncbi:hypothetical protein HQ533_04185 [Candidatus Woesearchaeota archaeon]|nr:hypothetical protein [Candidatus Woesearchaeota archaeon]